MNNGSPLLVAMPLDELKTIIKETINQQFKAYFTDREEKEQADNLLTIDETSKLLRTTNVTVHKWKKNGLIKSYRIGRRIFFKKDEVLKALSTSRFDF